MRRGDCQESDLKVNRSFSFFFFGASSVNRSAICVDGI